MTVLDVLRGAVPALLALAAAFGFDRLTARRGLAPPGFAVPWRHALAISLLAGVLWVGVFAPLGTLGMAEDLDVSQLTVPRLFLLHELLAGTVVAWYLLGFAGVARRRTPAAPVELAPAEPAERVGKTSFRAQLGFASPRLGEDLFLGLLAGAAAWVAVLLVVAAVALSIAALGAEKALPQSPPAILPWLVALPVGVRLLVSVSAGVVEETFFRGFLQPRMGILLSSACFVLAHLSYEQPLLLVGVTFLSLFFALLVRWRQTIWPAVVAHAVFDAVQLLVVIPVALKFLPSEAAKALPGALLLLLR